MVEENLKQLAREIDREKWREIFENANVLLYEIGFILYNNEVGHIH